MFSYMSRKIEIRDVPEELHGQLEARAAMEGLSLSDYVLREIGRNREVRKSQPDRVSFARVSRETPRRRRLARPVTFASNAGLALLAYPCWRTAHIRWNVPPDRLLELMKTSERPLLYYSWRAYELPTFLAFRDVSRQLRPTGIGHDGLLSFLLQRVTSWAGYRVWLYRRFSPIRPTDQIVELVKNRRRNIGVFPDAGGPDGRVKPGLTAIARATNALVVPILARGEPSVTVKWPRRYSFPLPFCSVVVYTGDPLDGTTATADECQAALEELEAVASPQERAAELAAGIWNDLLKKPRDVDRSRQAVEQGPV